MKVTTISDFRKRSKEYFDQLIADQDVLLITRNDGQTIVAMSLASYNSMTETEYLLRSPANAARLHQSIADSRADKVLSKPLIDV